MSPSEPRFEVRVAESATDLRAAQRLRYDVFVTELGGDGPLVDHAQRLERDRFDPYCEHLLLIDTARAADPDGQVVGVYRVMTEEGAARAGQFYCADEYDLAPLLSSGRKVLELGRSCLHRDYRGGAAIYHLWNGLARVTLERRIEVLFGVASFHGTDVRALAEPLANLHHRYLAPPDLRVRTRTAHYQSLDLMPAEEIDRARAMRETPALIKGYLRLGGFVGDGAFVDHAFNTVDICLVLDTARMNPRQRAIYTGELRETAG
ncbi:MAG: GNAT family N-acetyltransferase [Rhodobacteraceae bacterium]|nr:GNAT family N-acetyltransferase [Paracoccaceae bacterium]